MRVADSLGEWIELLEQAGELVRVRAEVDPYLEISAITDRVSKDGNGRGAGNKALLFERVKGSTMPVLINAFGSERRMALALGVGRVEDVAERLEAMLNQTPPEGWWEKLKLLPKLAQLGAMFPKHVGSAP